MGDPDLNQAVLRGPWSTGQPTCGYSPGIYGNGELMGYFENEQE